MSARVVLVTGSTDGIGKETAFELARAGAEVVVHGRTARRAAETAEQICRDTGNRSLSSVSADFADLDQVRGMAAELAGRCPRLEVLVNNAGIYMDCREVTPSGLEMTFTVNHLAPFLLTNLLLHLLKHSAPARIINVTSIAHQRGTIDFEDLQGERRFDGYGAYAASKLANVLFTYELASRLEGTGVTANCLHPGVITTKLLRRGFGSTGAPVEAGAATSVYLALSPAVAQVTGRYFVGGQETASSWLSRDRTLARALWEVSESLCGLRASPGLTGGPPAA